MSEISNNICKVGEFKDAIFYEAICQCGNPDHNQELVVEIENFTNDDGTVKHREVNLLIYSEINTYSYTDFSAKSDYRDALEDGNYFAIGFHKLRVLLSNLAVKLRFTRDLWLNGYIKGSNFFTFRNEAALDDYVKAVISAKEQLKKEINNGKTSKKESTKGN